MRFAVKIKSYMTFLKVFAHIGHEERMRFAGKIKGCMTFLESLGHIGHEICRKDKELHDLFGRICTYRSWAGFENSGL